MFFTVEGVGTEAVGTERLVDGAQAQGSHSVVWNAAGVASGIYFYRLTGASFSRMGKMIVIK